MKHLFKISLFMIVALLTVSIYGVDSHHSSFLGMPNDSLFEYEQEPLFQSDTKLSFHSFQASILLIYGLIHVLLYFRQQPVWYMMKRFLFLNTRYFRSNYLISSFNYCH
ncbi:hypothetical protein AB3N04_18240 [Alkalihalophilus sp. As8PL]|uniref:DUF4405 domain-containing protein n=1 Tax=Alkalihalophilus sp. As8PL TaxID=3237103 RepID=A0AB39BRU1_9BACI